MLRQHERSVQLTASSLRHAAALHFLTHFLHQREKDEENGQELAAAAVDQPSQQRTGTAPSATKMKSSRTTEVLLRSARALQQPASTGKTTGEQEPQVQQSPPSPSPSTPSPHPRHEMMKFRQRRPSCTRRLMSRVTMPLGGLAAPCLLSIYTVSHLSFAAFSPRS
jgi:hypothetical protein